MVINNAKTLSIKGKTYASLTFITDYPHPLMMYYLLDSQGTHDTIWQFAYCLANQANQICAKLYDFKSIHILIVLGPCFTIFTSSSPNFLLGVPCFIYSLSKQQ